jgi:hypothetical protein
MAARPPDMRDWYTRQGLQVKGGGITLQAGGAIKGGQTDFNTGTGFYMGYSGGAYKFSVGNPSGNYIKWDGSTLTISGGVSVAYADITGTKPPTDADNTQGAIQGTTTITGGGITMSAGGSIKGGKTTYGSGTGFFLGYTSGAYKFDIGSASSYLRWTGTALSLVGDITGTSSIDISGTASFAGNFTTTQGYSAAVEANSSTSASYGVVGRSGGGAGILGTHSGTGYGVQGLLSLGVGAAVFGQVASTANAGAVGVHGYTAKSSGIGVVAENAAGGTALSVSGPMSITSTTKVTNLNADRVDDYHAGNASGNIPVSNGTVNTNLNADMLDGSHASAFATTTSVAKAVNYLSTGTPASGVIAGYLRVQSIDGAVGPVYLAYYV